MIDNVSLKQVGVFIILGVCWAIVWFSTFFSDFFDVFDHWALLIRFLTFVFSAMSFLIAFIALVGKIKYSDLTLKNIQLLSISAGLISLFLHLVYDHSLILHSVFINLFFDIIGLIAFIISLVILFQKRKINILLVVNIFASAYSFFFFGLLLLFLSIGFGPPS